MTHDDRTHAAATMDVPCCPELQKLDCCDRLDFKYTTTHRASVPGPAGTNLPAEVPVEVVIHVRLERCPGPYTLGDLAYTTTLLPGEKVRLFSSDRRSRFSFDTETKVSYRHAQASEEQFYMSSVGREMSDLNVTESGNSSSHAWGDWGADMDSYYASAIFAGTAGGSIEGHYDDQSTHEFLRSLRSHAESAHYRSEMATRTSSSISVGEVTSRTHTEGESEDHFESASRIFANPNRCHAITFFFWRIYREQVIKFTLVTIERRVKDPAAPTRITSRPPVPPTGVSVVPTSVLGTAANRLDTEARARQSVAAKVAVALGRSPATVGAEAEAAMFPFTGSSQPAQAAALEPIAQETRAKALQQVDERLVKAGLLAAVGGEASPQIIQQISFERHFCLPTPGLLVKGCLDDCDVCEPTLIQEIETELERKKLQNELLKRQIELLDKSQEYRCCPKDSEEEEP
jgi:hypothetical protein